MTYAQGLFGPGIVVQDYMGQTKSRFSKRLLFRRSLGFLLLSWIVSTYPGCSTKPLNQDLARQDLTRIRHARELLPHQYKKSGVIQFEGDFKIGDYVEKYIKEVNPDLDAQALTETLMKVSTEYGYDPVFLLAVMKTESKFNPETIGAAGEIGLMQIKPSTAEWICEKRGIPWLGAEKMKNPVYNLILGAHYFSYLKTTLHNESARYINAYNMGINNLQRLPASSQARQPYFSRIIVSYLAIYSALQKYRNVI